MANWPVESSSFCVSNALTSHAVYSSVLIHNINNDATMTSFARAQQLFQQQHDLCGYSTIPLSDPDRLPDLCTLHKVDMRAGRTEPLT